MSSGRPKMHGNGVLTSYPGLLTAVCHVPGFVSGPGNEVMCRHAGPCAAMLAHVPPCWPMCRHASPCAAMLAHVPPCWPMCRHASPCAAMLAHVPPCWPMCRHAGPCAAMLAHVPPCWPMCRHASPCAAMLAVLATNTGVRRPGCSVPCDCHEV